MLRLNSIKKDLGFLMITYFITILMSFFTCISLNLRFFVLKNLCLRIYLKKRHEKPMPVLIGLAFLITIGINILMHDFDFNAFIIALIGAIGIFAIGIYDDKKNLSAWIKILLQVLLISLLFINDLKIEYINIPLNATPIFFNDWLAYLITLIWMLTIINIFNIIDGIDGLSTGVSFLTSIALFFVSLSVSPRLLLIYFAL